MVGFALQSIKYTTKYFISTEIDKLIKLNSRRTLI